MPHTYVFFLDLVIYLFERHGDGECESAGSLAVCDIRGWASRLKPGVRNCIWVSLEGGEAPGTHVVLQTQQQGARSEGGTQLVLP